MPEDAQQIAATYFVLCDSVNRMGGKVTLYGIFDRLFASSFPANHPQCALALSLFGPPDEEAMVEVRFRDSDDGDVVPAMRAGPFRFSPFGTANAHLNLLGLPITREGFFRFEARTDPGSDPIATCHLFVERRA